MSRVRDPRGAGRRACRGFTLLEVLIAAVILAVGLLALAIAELSSAGTNRGSRQVSLATAFGEEIVERIRRNRDEVSAYDGFDTDDVAGTRPNTAGTLQTDYDDWRARITQSPPNGLPSGRGVVDVTASTPLADTTLVTVTITWAGGPPGGVRVETVLY